MKKDGVNEIAQQKRMLGNKPEDPSSIPRNHMIKGGNRLPSCMLSTDLHTCTGVWVWACMYVHAYTHA